MKSSSRLRKLLLLASTPLALSFATQVSAQEADSLFDAIANGDAYLDTRFRVETVTDDSKAFNGTATTLRSKLSYKTESFKNFSGTVSRQTKLD